MTGARLTFVLGHDESLIVAEALGDFGTPSGVTLEVGVGVTGPTSSLLELADYLDQGFPLSDASAQAVAEDLARRIRREVRP